MLHAVRGTEAYAPFKGQWADSVVAPPSEGLLVRTIKCCGHTPERLRRKAILASVVLSKMAKAEQRPER